MISASWVKIIVESARNESTDNTTLLAGSIGSNQRSCAIGEITKGAPKSESMHHAQVPFEVAIAREPVSFVKPYGGVLVFDGQCDAFVSELARSRNERVEQPRADAFVAFTAHDCNGNTRSSFVDETVSPQDVRASAPGRNFDSMAASTWRPPSN
jgi:hypothetical protein